MDERRARWNARYARGEETHDHLPSSPLPEAIGPEPPWPIPMIGALPDSASRLALDLACGAGRHALFLAARGFRVIAVDYAEAGLELLRQQAESRGLADRIETVTANLSAGELVIEPDRYDIICDFYFLDRSLFPAIRAGVREGGLFVAAIHVEDAAQQAPHRFLLAPGELLRTVETWGFEVLLYREGPTREDGHAHAVAELVARFPLRNV